MVRTLRSKRLRAALYIAADGKCQMCGCQLGEDWHADHIIPWSISGRTNIHEMQALCPTCNLSKGNRMELREHQRRLADLGENVAARLREPSVIADVTPGGGKSAGICLFFKPQIQSGMIDCVLWACPRKALVSQCHQAWSRWSGLPASKLIAVHYDQINQQHIQLTESRRIGLAADELQFLADRGSGKWSSAMEELKRHAVSFLGVSGTLERNNKQPLLGVRYAKGNSVQELTGPQYDPLKSYPIADVTYNLRRALDHNVVCPFDIRQELGRVTLDGQTFNIFDPESAAVKGVLKPYLEDARTWQPIIDQTVESWLAYRKSHYLSKMIVIAASQEHADTICAYLGKRGIRCCLAVSDNSDAQYEIEDFKNKKFDGRPRAMVTVAMASVGLDVPDVSHLAYLTHYRFAGWMLQAWARASRICYDCGIAPEKQVAYISTIRDPRMDQFVDWIKSQTPKGLSESTGTNPGGGSDPPEIAALNLENAELIGCEFETSDIREGIAAHEAAGLATLIRSAPVLASVDKNILRQIAPAIDTSKICDSAKVSPENWVNIGESKVKVQRAIRAFIASCVNRIAKETAEDEANVRVDFYSGVTEDGYSASINDFYLTSDGGGTLIDLFVVAAEKLLHHGIDKVSYNYRIKPDWPEGKQQQMQERAKELASLMADLLSVYHLPVRVVAKRRA